MILLPFLREALPFLGIALCGWVSVLGRGCFFFLNVRSGAQHPLVCGKQKILMNTKLLKPLLSQRCCRRLAAFSTSAISHTTSRPPFNPASDIRFTEPPNPQWKIGDGLPLDTAIGKQWKEDEAQGWKTWDTKTTTGRYAILL